jgi:hypothetical protein
VGLIFLTGQILNRNCQLKHVIEGNAEGRLDMRGGQGRRYKQLLDDLDLYPTNVENWASS